MKNLLAIIIGSSLTIAPMCSGQKPSISKQTVAAGPGLEGEWYTGSTFLDFHAYVIQKADSSVDADTTWISYKLCVDVPSGSSGGGSCYEANGTVPVAAIKVKPAKLLTLDLDLARYGVPAWGVYCTDLDHCVPITPKGWQVHIECRANGFEEYEDNVISRIRTRSPDGLVHVERRNGPYSSSSCDATGTIAGFNLADLGTIRWNWMEYRNVIREFERWKE